MSRGPLTYRKSDLKRALAAAAETGHHVQRAEIDKTGKIVVIFSDEQPTTSLLARDWDEALNNDR
jgi:hypothetical protein